MWQMILVRLLGAILKRVTPSLRDALIETIKTLEAKANATPNTWDNYLVDTLKALLGIE